MAKGWAVTLFSAVLLTSQIPQSVTAASCEALEHNKIIFKFSESAEVSAVLYIFKPGLLDDSLLISNGETDFFFVKLPFATSSNTFFVPSIQGLEVLPLLTTQNASILGVTVPSKSEHVSIELRGLTGIATVSNYRARIDINPTSEMFGFPVYIYEWDIVYELPSEFESDVVNTNSVRCDEKTFGITNAEMMDSEFKGSYISFPTTSVGPRFDIRLIAVGVLGFLVALLSGTRASIRYFYDLGRIRLWLTLIVTLLATPLAIALIFVDFSIDNIELLGVFVLPNALSLVYNVGYTLLITYRGFVVQGFVREGRNFIPAASVSLLAKQEGKTVELSQGTCINGHYLFHTLAVKSFARETGRREKIKTPARLFVQAVYGKQKRNSAKSQDIIRGQTPDRTVRALTMPDVRF